MASYALRYFARAPQRHSRSRTPVYSRSAPSRATPLVDVLQVQEAAALSECLLPPAAHTVMLVSTRVSTRTRRSGNPPAYVVYLCEHCRDCVLILRIDVPSVSSVTFYDDVSDAELLVVRRLILR